MKAKFKSPYCNACFSFREVGYKGNCKTLAAEERTTHEYRGAGQLVLTPFAVVTAKTAGIDTEGKLNT